MAISFGHISDNFGHFLGLKHLATLPEKRFWRAKKSKVQILPKKYFFYLTINPGFCLSKDLKINPEKVFILHIIETCSD